MPTKSITNSRNHWERHVLAPMDGRKQMDWRRDVAWTVISVLVVMRDCSTKIYAAQILHR